MEESAGNKLRRLFWSDVFYRFIGEPKVQTDGTWNYDIEVRTIKYYFLGIRIWTKTTKDNSKY